jgi:hypothetical protein
MQYSDDNLGAILAALSLPRKTDDGKVVVLGLLGGPWFCNGDAMGCLGAVMSRAGYQASALTANPLHDVRGESTKATAHARMRCSPRQPVHQGRRETGASAAKALSLWERVG